MPKEYLTGSLEEQCDFLYDMAIEKMQQGNFIGAAHVLKEVVKYQPDFKDAQALLAIAKQRRSEQRWLLIISLIGLAGGVFVGSVRSVANDFWLLLYAGVGLLVGYAIGNVLNSLRRSRVA